MNRQETIERLETLLERVQTRAKQPRSKQMAVVTAEPTEDKQRAASIEAPTSHMVDKDETQPFERDAHGSIHVRKPVEDKPLAPTVGATPVAAADSDLELEIDVDLSEVDDVSSGALEIVTEPPTLPKNRQVAVSETDESFSSLPEAQTQPLMNLELDSGAVAPSGASDAILGATVELEEGTGQQSPVELDPKPPKATARPSAEMEMVLPTSIAPGEFSPNISSQLPSPTRPEETKTEPAEDAALSVKTDERKQPPEPSEAMPQKPSEEKKAVVKLEVPKAPEPLPAANAEPTPAQPVTIELAGQSVTSEIPTTETITQFVGGFEATTDETFVAWLDETLSLGA